MRRTPPKRPVLSPFGRVRLAGALLGLFLLLSVPGRGEEGGGIAWEVDLAQALGRAASEGRPVLLAVNALETEAANQHLARDLYGDPAWGEATEDWVALVANPNVHGGGPVCERYGRIPCDTHQATLRYVIRRFARTGDLISPQHLILDPDERLAWRKEFFTGVVGPAFFERWLPRVSPGLGLERAAALRQDRIDALDDAPLESVTEAAVAWLASDDPLAACGVLKAADFSLEDRRRHALIQAFAHVPEEQIEVPWIAAYDAAVDPGSDSETALAWVRAMLAADRERGLALAARAAVHAGDDATRRPFLRILFDDAAPPARLPSRGDGEVARLRVETYRLLGRPVSEDAGRQEAPDGVEAMRRRRARASHGGRRWPPLDEALQTPYRVAGLRGALVEATPNEVRAREADVRRLFHHAEEERIRVAAALAMLGAGLDEGGRVPEVVRNAVFDIVESTDVRPEAVKRLGQDPGYDEDAWLAALRQKVSGR